MLLRRVALGSALVVALSLWFPLVLAVLLAILAVVALVAGGMIAAVVRAREKAGLPFVRVIRPLSLVREWSTVESARRLEAMEHPKRAVVETMSIGAQ